jgi:hypothetical protein
LAASSSQEAYMINDFYINTFFSLINPIISSIKRNKNKASNIFANRILNNDKYYISNFTGSGYKRLVRYCIETYSLDSKLFKQLLLKDYDFEIYILNDKLAQIDLILENKTDRILRVIECKWSLKSELKWLDEVINKKFMLNEKFTRINIIACIQASEEFLEKASAKDVKILLLEDLIQE